MALKKETIDDLKNRITKDSLQEFYFEHNHSDTSKHFEISGDKLTALLKEYHIVKTKNLISEQIKKTKQDRYRDLKELNKLNLEKSRKTKIERYGSLESAQQSRISKMKATRDKQGVSFESTVSKIDKDEFVKLYIVENKSRTELCKIFNVSEWILDKLINFFDCHKDKHDSASLMLESKYSMFGSKEAYDAHVQERLNARYIENYGSIEAARKHISEKCKEAWAAKTPEEYRAIQDQTRNTCLQKYGVYAACQLPQARSVGNDSKPNRNFASMLDSYSIPYSREYNIENRSYDFKISDNVLVEINPSSSHNSTWGMFGSDPMPKYYHYNKTILANRYDFRCIHVWDWDNIDKVRKLVETRKKVVYARNCDIRDISAQRTILDNFLNMFHLQGTCKGQSVCYGLFYKDELIQLITFGKPRYNKKYEYELLRLCTSSDFRVVGGSEKLFKHFENVLQPMSIISYCDNSKFNGNVYKRLRMTLLDYGQPSKHWYNMKTGKHITDNLLRQRGFDQLLGKEYGCFGKGTSNDELMKQHGFVEIWDAGQSTYVWKK